MSDTAEARMLARLQSLGSNVNTWGGYVNDNFEITGRHNKGYQALAITGDATVSWTNYSKVNDGQVATLKLTGALTAAATLTFGSRENELKVYNTTTGGFAVTIKCAAGTGVSIPNGYLAELYCDGTDYYNGAPMLIPGALTVAGQIHGVTAGTAGTDATNLTQMSAAIAASVPAGTAGTFLNTVSDTTRGYLTDKVTVTANKFLALATANPAGNEVSTFTVDQGQVALYARTFG